MRKLIKSLQENIPRFPVSSESWYWYFYLTFNVIGAWLQGLLEIGIDKVSALVEAALTAANVNSAMHSLVIDGIFYRCGKCTQFSADYRNPVFLSVSYGRQRIRCTCCFCDGQTSA